MKNKLLSFLIGSFIGFLVILASIFTERGIININIDAILFFMGPCLIMLKTIKPYFFMYSLTLLYYGVIVVLFNSIILRRNKLILFFCLICLHLISAYIFNKVFSIKF